MQTATQARPFVKWVGGKTQLLPELARRLPEEFDVYHEPFLGGGALFFALRPKVAILSDLNAELINLYQVVAKDVEALIRALKLHRYEEAYYYGVRAQDREETFHLMGPVARAARFLFINKTGYNGLWRVNSKGQCNVPFGDYTNPVICDESNLRACAEVLATQPLRAQSYTATTPGKGDFVYFDPPYEPLTTTANFTGYAAGGFTSENQRTLCSYLKSLDQHGVKWMLSNSSAPLILDLYKDFNLELVDAKRAVNSDPAKRGPVKEVIVRNYGGDCSWCQRPDCQDKI